MKLQISEKGLEIISNYARNGREAVNMIQIAAGIAITEKRTLSKMKILNGWFIAVNLHQEWNGKYNLIPRVGLVNGLAVYGPNTGLVEIEVTVIPAKDKGFNQYYWNCRRRKYWRIEGKSIRRKSMAKGSIENVITVLRSMGVPADEYDIHVNFPGGIP